MDNFIKNQRRLIECYRASSNAEEAETNCSKYLEEMKTFVNNGGLEYPNVMKDIWRMYNRTRQYYAPKQ